MFLTPMAQLDRAARDDNGSALAGVLGVMSVGLILTSLVLASVVNGIGFTSATRAGVQSQASAEAGIAVARVGIQTGTCATNGGVYRSAAGATPSYTVDVFRPSGSAWVRGCPISPTAPVRLVASGAAAAAGVGQSRGDESFVETVISPGAPTTSTTPSGPAVYSFLSAGLGGSGQLRGVNGSRPSIQVKTGDVQCSENSSSTADWIVESGALQLSNNCSIGGSTWSGRTTSMTSNLRITGNVVADGVTMGGNSAVGGSVWSSDGFVVTGNTTVTGNVSAASLGMTGNSKILADAWINGFAEMGGSSRIDGTLTASTESGANGRTGRRSIGLGALRPSPWTAPARPMVPNWIDFDYDRSDWPGFEPVSPTGCDANALQRAIANLGTRKGIIDARSCVRGVTLVGNERLEVRADLAIFASGFAFTDTQISADSAARLWLIKEDTVADSRPTCQPDLGSSLSGNAAIDRDLAVMWYAPCGFSNLNNSTFNGQVFARQTTFNANTQMGYVPVGLPGVDLTTGAPTPPTGAPQTFITQSTRNLERAG